VSQQLWQRDQQLPVLPRHAERVPPWWCVCLSCLWDYSWIFFRWCYLINKIPWNFCLHSLKLNFLGLIHFVILCCWSRLLSLDHKYLNEPVMLEYVVHAYDHRLHSHWDGMGSSISLQNRSVLAVNRSVYWNRRCPVLVNHRFLNFAPNLKKIEKNHKKQKTVNQPLYFGLVKHHFLDR
jgi:hypothetical protein